VLPGNCCEEFGSTLNVNLATQHDISWRSTSRRSRSSPGSFLRIFLTICILGEEAVTGNPNADVRWVVDPLDGTVNYFYGIPHYAYPSRRKSAKMAIAGKRSPVWCCAGD